MTLFPRLLCAAGVILLIFLASAHGQIANSSRISPYNAPGSIFPTDPGDGRMNSLVSDPTAYSVGDFVTIVVNLSNTANQSRAVTTAKKASVNDTITSIINPNNTNLAAQWAGNQAFAGSGTQANTDGLTTTIQARIVESLPNNTLRVEATRYMEVGKEKGTMVLTGLVRRADLASDNSISSNQVADLQIKQSGTGDLSRNTHKGWLTSIYEFVSPF
jgi:flagellar L-ring protein precursor FlgH